MFKIILALCIFFNVQYSHAILPEDLDSFKDNKLIVLPDERLNGVDVETDDFIRAIDKAEEKIIMASYKLHEHMSPEPAMLDAIKRATARGVQVAILLEQNLTDMEKLKGCTDWKPGMSEQAYKDAGAETFIFDSKKYNFFSKPERSQSHTKFIVVDNQLAILGNTNFDKDFRIRVEDLDARGSRDFAIIEKEAEVINDLSELFEAVINKEPLPELKSKKLVLGPVQLREKLYRLINDAENKIDIYQQDITDKATLEVLRQTALRGVNVSIYLSEHPFGKDKKDNNIGPKLMLKEAGATIVQPQYITHAKTILIDDKIAVISSVNFYEDSIDNNVNLLYITDNPEIAQGLLDVMDRDRDSSNPFN